MNDDDFRVLIEKGFLSKEVDLLSDKIGDLLYPVIWIYDEYSKESKERADEFLKGCIYALIMGLLENTDESLNLVEELRRDIIKIDNVLVKR